MWLIILLIVLTALISGFIWLSHSICHIGLLEKHLPTDKKKKRWVGVGIAATLMLLTYLSLDFINMVIVFLHLIVIWLAFDFIEIVSFKIGKRPNRTYHSGYCALLATVICLTLAWRNAHHVVATHYDIQTEKSLGIGNLKVVALSDSHVGATFHWQEFEKHIETINQEKPDLVVIMGDFVDDDTSKEDMEQSCRALGNLHTTYGTYLVYGNHDEGYWANNGRGYSLADMDRCLEENNVRVLRDESTPIAGNVFLCGRLDKARSRDRKSAKDLMKERSDIDYVITLDHEPNDYKAEEESRMDLVVSGHTHGGQFVGLGQLGVWIGANDAYYGHEKRGATDFLISSGIGDWAIQFKTGCIAEYLVIDIHGKE